MPLPTRFPKDEISLVGRLEESTQQHYGITECSQGAEEKINSISKSEGVVRGPRTLTGWSIISPVLNGNPYRKSSCHHIGTTHPGTTSGIVVSAQGRRLLRLARKVGATRGIHRIRNVQKTNEYNQTANRCRITYSQWHLRWTSFSVCVCVCV